MKRWGEYDVEIVKDRKGSSQVKIRIIGAPIEKHHMIGKTEQVSRGEVEDVDEGPAAKPAGRTKVFEVRYGRVKKTHKTYHIVNTWNLETLCHKRVLSATTVRPEGNLCAQCRTRDRRERYG